MVRSWPMLKVSPYICSFFSLKTQLTFTSDLQEWGWLSARSFKEKAAQLQLLSSLWTSKDKRNIGEIKWRTHYKKTLLRKQISSGKISLKKERKEEETMCVNFSVNMIELRDAWIASKTFFLNALWECFWKKLVFETVDRVKKIVFISVDGPHSICWRPSKTKKAEKKAICPSCLRWDSRLLLPSEYPVFWSSDLEWILHHCHPWFSGLYT